MKNKNEELMNKIQAEYNESRKYVIEVGNDGLVVLSRENVAKVEFMIRIDSSYRKSCDRKAVPRGNYRGSSAYWFSQLSDILDGTERSTNGYDRNRIINEIVGAIDRENSTRLTTDGVGRTEMSNRLLALHFDDILSMLKNTEDMPLYYLLCEETKPTDVKYKARRNPSFASKFCHYACFYLFEGQKEQDNYSIYDRVIRKVLPQYAEKYKVEKVDLTDYRKYMKTIDAIIEKSDAEISRNGFDHLLWYFHKGS